MDLRKRRTPRASGRKAVRRNLKVPAFCCSRSAPGTASTGHPWSPANRTVRHSGGWLTFPARHAEVADHRGHDAVGVPVLQQYSRFRAGNHFRRAPYGRADHRRAARHRFQQDIGPAFAAGGQHQGVGAVVHVAKSWLVDIAQKADAVAARPAARQRLPVARGRVPARRSAAWRREAWQAPRSRNDGPCARSTGPPMPARNL